MIPAVLAESPLRRFAAGRGLRVEWLEQRVALDGRGLVGQYFHNADFTGLAVERVEAVSFPWGTAAPGAGIRPDGFSVRWIGQVEARFSETYAFRTVSDDGVRLWVDGQLLIDDWSPQAARVESGTIALEAGQRYDVRLEYYDAAGAAQIRLQWSSPSQPLEDLPAAALHGPEPGLRGRYADAAGGEQRRVDATVDFAWPGAPLPGIAADNFRVTWTGYVRSDYSDQYAFRTVSDDGVRVWVGDRLIIDNWTPHAAAADAGSIVLEAGKWYDLRIEYFDVVGDAEARLAWSGVRQTGEGVFETIPAHNLRAAQRAPLYFTNPLGFGADPFVIRYQDSYLHVRSSGGSIFIDKAAELQDVHRDTPESASVRAWTPPAGTAYSTMLWAPELHQIDGKWYIYVAAAANNDNATHRMYVLERDNPDPMGSYNFKGQIATSPDRWAIDGTVLQWEGKLYFIWSGWPGFVDGQQNLYIAEMSNPWTVASARVQIATPTYAWEKHGLPINEGPQVLTHEGQLHIIYSASGYWTHQYALGRLTYNGSGSLLSASSWTKAPSPAFMQSGEIVGTGHASFTQSPDGTQSWIVYHAHHDKNNWRDDRDILIQPFTYFANGTPNFGTPVPTATRMEVPTGTPDPNRSLLEGDYDASGAVDQRDLQTLTAQWGQTVFPGVASDGSRDGFIDGHDFLVWQRRHGATVTTAAAGNMAAQTAEPANEVAALGAAFEEPALEGRAVPAWWIDSPLDTTGGAWLSSHDAALADWPTTPGRPRFRPAGSWVGTAGASRR